MSIEPVSATVSYFKYIVLDRVMNNKRSESRSRNVVAVRVDFQ